MVLLYALTRFYLDDTDPIKCGLLDWGKSDNIIGYFSNKSDVFSFGVLVLEIVSSQRTSDFRGSENSTRHEAKVRDYKLPSVISSSLFFDHD